MQLCGIVHVANFVKYNFLDIVFIISMCNISVVVIYAYLTCLTTENVDQ